MMSVAVTISGPLVLTASLTTAAIARMSFSLVQVNIPCIDKLIITLILPLRYLIANF